MFERFTDHARRVMILAQEEARLLGHDYVGTEHLLLGISRHGGSAAEALDAVNAPLPVLRERLEAIVGRASVRPSGHIAFTPHAKKALELSAVISRELNQSMIATGHLLLGVLQTDDGVAIQVLQQLGVGLGVLRDLVLEAIATTDERAIENAQPFDVGSESRARLTPSASYGPEGSLPDVCGFCGRRLRDADRYVRGPNSAMCDRCLTTAAELLASSAEPQIGLPLADAAAQDRTGLDEPPDDDAVAEITTAILGVFGDWRNEANVRDFFEDASQHDALLSFEPIPYVAQANVGEIRFLDADTAEVEFDVTLGGSPFGRFRGNVRRRDGRWVVTAETVRLVYIGLRIAENADEVRYDNPEDAALASWSSTLAELAMLTVTKEGQDTTTVTISIASLAPMQVFCERLPDRSWRTHGWSSTTL